jgi:hypothetical protein
MTTVIPLFIEDEITGLTIPNKGCPEHWIMIKDGMGLAIYNTWNDVLANIHKYSNDTQIVYFPRSKPHGQDW